MVEPFVVIYLYFIFLVKLMYFWHAAKKAIRHIMSTILSADGHWQERKVKEQWGKSRERAVFPMLFAIAHTGRESEEKGRWAGKVEIQISWWAYEKLIERIARSRDFPHCSFTFLSCQWPSADKIVDIMCRIALSTVCHMSLVLTFWSIIRSAL